MWFVFGLVTLLAAGIVSYRYRRADRWKGEVQTGGWRLQVARNARTKSVSSVTIGVDCASAFEFECKPESGFDRLCKRTGLTKEFQVGHAAFDNDVYLICDDVRMRALLRADGRLVEDLHSLVVGGKPVFTLRELVCRGGQLRATYSGRGTDAEVHGEGGLLQGALPRLQAVQAALPPAATLAGKHRDPLFLRSVAVLAASTALTINGILQLLRLMLYDDTIIVDRARFWTFGLAAGALLLLLLVAMALWLLAGTSRLQLVLVEVLVVGTFGCFISGVTLVRDANMALDFAAAQPQRGMVGYKDTRVSRNNRGQRSTSYYVTYHGVELPDDGVIRVSRGQYERMRTAMPVVVNFHDGALGIRWVSSIDPAPYEFDLTP